MDIGLFSACAVVTSVLQIWNLSPIWPTLQQLDISNNLLTSDQLKNVLTIRHSNAWKHIKVLSICVNKIDGEGFMFMLNNDSQIMPKLTRLLLCTYYSNKITSESMSKTRNNSESFRNIRYLNLADNRIGMNGCFLLSKLSMVNLEQLILDRNHIQNQHVRILVKAKWPYIHTMSLRQNNLREEGYTYVYLSCWHQIKQIDFRDNYLNEPCLMYLLLNQWPRSNRFTFDFIKHTKWNLQSKLQSILYIKY